MKDVQLKPIQLKPLCEWVLFFHVIRLPAAARTAEGRAANSQ